MSDKKSKMTINEDKFFRLFVVMLLTINTFCIVQLWMQSAACMKGYSSASSSGASGICPLKGIFKK